MDSLITIWPLYWQVRGLQVCICLLVCHMLTYNCMLHFSLALKYCPKLFKRFKSPIHEAKKMKGNKEQ